MSGDGRDGDDNVVDPATAADIIEEAEPIETVEVDEESDDEEGAVAGSFAPDVAVTPQVPARENVIFVALGVYLTILALAQTVPGVGVAPATILLVTVVVAVGTVVCYGALVWTTPDT